MAYTTIMKLARSIAFPLALIMLAGASRPNVAHAVMVSTDEVIHELAVEDGRARVRDFLARADVRQQMAALGVDAAEAEARIATLSDAEVQQIVDRLDRLPAGQSTAGVIVGAIVLVFLILLLTDIIGWTNVYPFVHSP